MSNNIPYVSIDPISTDDIIEAIKSIPILNSTIKSNTSIGLNQYGFIIHSSQSDTFSFAEFNTYAKDTETLIIGSNVKDVSKNISQVQQEKLKKIYVFNKSLADEITSLEAYVNTISVEIIDNYDYISTIINSLKNVDSGSGIDGIGISNVEITETGELEITYTNNTTVNLGKVVGEDGYTPVKGKDYFTDDDKSEIEADIVEVLNSLTVSIPNTIYITANNEFRMYFKNICSREDVLFWFGTSSGLTLKKYDDYLSVTATGTGTKSLTYKIYSKTYELITRGTISFVVSANAENNAKVMVIGDSTVTQSNAIVTQIYNRYADAGVSVELLGTRGTAPYLHEGRAGWTAEKYCTVVSSGNVANPFYNDGFDFAYYMEQQSYDNVDVVAIQLGINDIFPMTLDNYTAKTSLGYINTMIDSIKAYDSNIKVVISLIIPPNTNGSSFTTAYGTSQIDWVHHYNCIRFAKDTIDYFKNTSNVYLSANNCVLDTDTDINDGVHPTIDGYVKLGNAIYDTLANLTIEDNGSDGGDEEETTNELWDAGSRTAMVKSYASATGTRTISNDYYYYPAAYTGAWSNNYEMSNVEVETDTLQFSSPASAFGIFIPFLGLDASKTYRFKVNPTVEGFRVYRVDYDSTGVYVGNDVVVDKTTGLTTYDFTPTEGYQQGFCFACLSATKDLIGKFSDLSLIEI